MKRPLSVAMIATFAALAASARSAHADDGKEPAAAPAASNGPSPAPVSSAPNDAAPEPKPAEPTRVGEPEEPTEPSRPTAAPAPAAPSGPKTEEDPLVVPEGIRPELGSAYLLPEPQLDTRVRTGLWPLAYKERLRTEITTVLFPLYFDRRGLDAQGAVADRESLYGLYFRKRSPKNDVDMLFPLFASWRNERTHTTVVPPFLWRTGAQGEWHGWLAPLLFASWAPDGSYLHVPPLLTFTHRTEHKAFSLIGGLGFYDRVARDVDWGIVPLLFGGHNGDKLTNYFLIPPLLTYHHENADLNTSTTLVGPVYVESAPKSGIFDILPLWFHSHGDDYESNMLLPLFYVSRDKDAHVLATALFYSRRDNEGTTLVTPLYTRSRGRTQLDLAGPLVPIFAHYTDNDIHREAWLVGPVWSAHDPTGYTLLTPLFGQWNEYGVSRTTWVFPTFQHTVEPTSWTFNVHPLLYLGVGETSSHSVVAPIWWDFRTQKSRTTIGFPLLWRFHDEEGTLQVLVNTLYLDHPSSKGPNWDFYFLPLVHVGDRPNGHVWDFLFGLVGYKRDGGYKELKLFYVPIGLAGTAPP